MARLVRETVARRGKQHNPVTGSGGMLLGVVRRVGTLVQDRGFSPGDRAWPTLASLSLTPLEVRAVRAVRPVLGPARRRRQRDRVRVGAARQDAGRLAGAARARGARRRRGRASGRADGAGERTGDRVVVLRRRRQIGPSSARRRERVGASAPSGLVVGVESHPPFAAELEALGVCDAVIAGRRARDPVAVKDLVLPALDGAKGRGDGSASGSVGADLTLSCVNIEGVELAAILVTRDRGKVYFFAMSTSFTRAALGAEGVGRDVDLYIGNGYAKDHAEHTLALVREHEKLRELLTRATARRARRAHLARAMVYDRAPEASS